MELLLLNSSFSDFLPTKLGLPQGSGLGPLLFLIYINHLEVIIKSKIKLFEDNTMLLSVARNSSISALELNHDLQLINNWAYQSKMNLILKLTNKQCIFYFPQNTSPIPHPYRNGFKFLLIYIMLGLN